MLTYHRNKIQKVKTETPSQKTERLVEWANEVGCNLYGPRHNTDGRWSATLGTWMAHGFESMQDAIEGLQKRIGDCKP